MSERLRIERENSLHMSEWRRSVALDVWADCSASPEREVAPLPESFARNCDYCGTRHETIGNCVNCGAPKR